ncbi:hypothetical protein N0V93_010108 [Gnomoniopsis smithogilvyi]|uniref:Dihydroxyacetone kinase n=1 Tax=Gnomoniopsis smithogilvyi TaxID=1191159 RepID=A0A9W8YJR7_9PEZI|nr:hypothetical protein N0V93_010108 [Gnomoniopsis smithogilvyi]
MSKAHLFHSTDGLVAKSLRGLISYNPSLSLDETNRVVFDTKHDPSHVSIISGGGSGHEPAWSGYVGENMLAASVGGDIFASPSTRQILAAIDAVPSDKGTILVVTNYTGDCLHFGLANEKAIARGHRCRMIICGDDVSVGRKGSLVGRRGLAGQIGVLKIMGGAAGQGASLDDVYDLGVAFSQQIVSIAATLDHCHVPGRTEHAMLGEDEVELGTGPHNEPGYKKLSPAPSAEELVHQILTHCLDEKDPERGYVHFSPGDEVFLLISNFGGMSQLELGALTDELLEQLAVKWNIEPVRVYVGPLETSLNAPAFSVSVINVTAAAKNCKYSVEQIKEFADVKTTTFWESMAGFQGARRNRQHQFVKPPEEPKKVVDPAKDLKIDPVILNKMLRSACAALVQAEPDLTKWDTVMGDGDCGETLRTGATSLVAALDQKNLAGTGSVITVLHELEDIVETKMGGTLGGILGIFFVALRNAAEQNVSSAQTRNTAEIWGRSLAAALDQLSQYTPAKVGDRTVMDTLIPFAEMVQKSGNLDDAVSAAVKGAEATSAMTPRLGRATYVAAGRENGNPGQLPPDPGAWGAMVAIRGLRDGRSAIS